MNKITFKSWASASRGRQSDLARYLGVSPQLVHYWARINRIPAWRLSAVEKFTGIPREFLNPVPFRGRAVQATVTGKTEPAATETARCATRKA